CKTHIFLLGHVGLILHATMAHALMRAAPPLMVGLGVGSPGIETSLDAARMIACATKESFRCGKSNAERNDREAMALRAGMLRESDEYPIRWSHRQTARRKRLKPEQSCDPAQAAHWIAPFAECCT